MSEIPEDILAKAETVYGVLETTNPHYQGSRAELLDIKVITLALMEAVEAEREGCAKVADHHFAKIEAEGDSDPWSYGFTRACENIAAAIRDRGGKNE